MAYYRMALAAGIEMSDVACLEEKQAERHFMTKALNRTDAGEKSTCRAPCGMRHFDFNQVGYFSYEAGIRDRMRMLR